MKYRIFNGPAVEFSHGDFVPPLRYTGQAVVVIDPSKTNCAMVIGDPGGEVQMIVEMTGNGWRQDKPTDTTQYCSELREFITRLLEPCEVYMFKAEQAITKKGMNHHMSSMVLTEIRAALLGLAWENYGFRKEEVEVNNWAWKKYVLPEGYRSQSEKGSIRYFYQYLGDTAYLNYFEADVTDCLCIYKYAIRNCKDTYRIVCTEAQKAIKQYSYAIMPEWADTCECREFTYNNSFTMEENVIWFANHSRSSGIAKIKTDRLNFEEIYEHASGFSEVPKGEVRLIVAL